MMDHELVYAGLRPLKAFADDKQENRTPWGQIWAQLGTVDKLMEDLKPVQINNISLGADRRPGNKDIPERWIA